jgi:hypothetical protein
MCHLRRQAALLANGDRLAHAVEHGAGFIAHVGDVDAAEASGDPRELDDFRRRRERAGHVEQTRAEPERAVLHALADQFAHPLELLGGCRAVDLANHRHPHRSLTDEARKVRRNACCRNFVQKRPERNGRAAVGPFDQGGHALADVIVGGGHLEDAAPGVRMDVDEPGRRDEATNLDHPGRSALNRRGDARDRIAAHGNVASVPRAPGSVDDPGAPQDEVVRRISRLRSRTGRRADEHQHQTPHAPRL